jgi:hypothetical protein
VSAEWTLAGVGPLHIVKVIVEPAVASNDVECGGAIKSFRLLIILWRIQFSQDKFQ